MLYDDLVILKGSVGTFQLEITRQYGYQTSRSIKIDTMRSDTLLFKKSKNTTAPLFVRVCCWITNPPIISTTKRCMFQCLIDRISWILNRAKPNYRGSTIKRRGGKQFYQIAKMSAFDKGIGSFAYHDYIKPIPTADKNTTKFSITATDQQITSAPPPSEVTNLLQFDLINDWMQHLGFWSGAGQPRLITLTENVHKSLLNLRTHFCCSVVVEIFK